MDSHYHPFPLHSDTYSKVMAALHKARVVMGPARKTASGQVGQQKTKYADLKAVLTACEDALEAEGIQMFQPPITEEREGGVIWAGIITQLWHAEGEWVGFPFLLKIGPNATAQAIGSAVTYARRYAIEGLLCLRREDDDGTLASQAAHQPQQRPQGERQAVAASAILRGQYEARLLKARTLAEIDAISAEANERARGQLTRRDQEGLGGAFAAARHRIGPAPANGDPPASVAKQPPAKQEQAPPASATFPDADARAVDDFSAWLAEGQSLEDFNAKMHDLSAEVEHEPTRKALWKLGLDHAHNSGWKLNAQKTGFVAAGGRREPAHA